MFGIPLETITLLASTAFSYWMKLNAQRNADMIKLVETRIKSNESDNKLMNAAAKRGTPWVRKFIAIFVMLIAFGGLLIAPAFNMPVEYVMDVPRKSILWGLIKWGTTYEIISSTGFLIPPYVRYTVMCIAGFFFGPGFAKVSR